MKRGRLCPWEPARLRMKTSHFERTVKSLSFLQVKILPQKEVS
jgi:hypothetical protein